jgi:hypothetical protein
MASKNVIFVSIDFSKNLSPHHGKKLAYVILCILANNLCILSDNPSDTVNMKAYLWC